MRLSAPIFRLKRAAKLLSREARIPLHDALDRVARSEGFNSWSHLSAAASHRTPVEMLYQSLAPGDVVLLGARPGHGKTLLALELLDEAIKEGRRGFFFTLEFSENDVADCIRAFNFDEALFRRLVVDTSDDIDADYMIARLAGSAAGALIVIDYLQLLDQKRTNPALAEQMARLEAFAREAGAIMIAISQVDRAFDPAQKRLPDIADIRLPNPLDLAIFTKTCFLHDGEIELRSGLRTG